MARGPEAVSILRLPSSIPAALMNTPPFLLGAALLFWGWQTGMMLPAVAMAVVLEAARWIEWRLDFKREDFDRVWDLCAALFLAAAVYCFSARNSTNALMEFFQTGLTLTPGKTDAFAGAFVFFEWWPLVFFPFAAAQAFAARGTVPASTFSWYLRRRRGEAENVLEREVNTAHAYLAVCLFSAGLSNARREWFFPGFALLLGWLLQSARPRRLGGVWWLVLLALVLKLGWWGAVGLHDAQIALEEKISAWAVSLGFSRLPRTESETMIGRIGRLKLSGSIVLRAEPVENSPAPPLLRDSTYLLFKSSRWTAYRRDYSELLPENDALTWKLLPGKLAPHTLRLWTSLPRGQGLLALPPGTAELDDLAVGFAETNRLGAVRVADAAGLLDFRARFGPGRTHDSPPEPLTDLNIPPSEAAVISQIAEELDLVSLNEEQKVAAIAAFFTQKFSYTTWLSLNALGLPRGVTPLENFLTRTRAGHCEYFGTAAVLLLRQAGIPARYANGYVLAERDGNSRRYVVRERHAHAWAIWWSERDQAWHDFDATPGGWLETEQTNASFWEPLSDWWSRLKFNFAQWRGRGAVQGVLLSLLILLVGVLVWRVLRHQHRKRREAAAGVTRLRENWPGLDSEFYLVEQRLAELGLTREHGETLSSWLTRVERAHLAQRGVLAKLLALHYRLRFDPRGLSGEERNALRSGVQAWMAETAKVG